MLATLRHRVGDTIQDRYEIEAELGSGAFGTVYKCRDKELDTLVAIGVSLFAGGLVFCMALLLLGAHKVPLHFGYGAILGGVIGCSFVFGPRDRPGLMVVGGLVVVWVLGTAVLYASRDQIVLRPHEHRSAAAKSAPRKAD